MKKIIAVSVSLLLPAIYSQGAAATETCPFGGSPNWQGICDTTTEDNNEYFGDPLSQEDADEIGIIETTPQPESEGSIQIPNISSPTYSHPSSTNENPIQEDYWTNQQDQSIFEDALETWAVVDENGNTINIISCDVDFCGSGFIPATYSGSTPITWSRVVLQSARDPETGKNNGGHWGTYNFSSNMWTKIGEDGATYRIPIEYGQEPVCIENCPVPEEPVEEPLATPEENDVVAEGSEPRSLSVLAETTKKTFSFSKKFPARKNLKGKNIWVIATNGSEKVVWKFKAAKKNKTKIVLPIKYADWNILVNYRLKNDKRISQKIILKY